MKKSICVIMAHADDIELNAGGAVARYAAEGYRVLYGVMSRCNSGWTVTAEKDGHYVSSLEIIPRRRAEAEAAAKVFGAELYYGDLLENCYTQKTGSMISPSFTGVEIEDRSDIPEGTPFLVAAGCGCWDNHPVVDEIANLLMTWEPELVIGQAIQNGNPDHFAAALIVAKAWKVAAEKKRIGPYWIAADIEFGRFPPIIASEFVDVNGYEEIALKALACHQSQGQHLANRQTALGNRWQACGEKAGFAAAEGFAPVFA